MMSETELKKEDIVIVEWQDGRYAGKRKPAVQARSIVEPNLGEISAGTKLKIKMGKSAAAKVWNVVFVGKAEDVREAETEDFPDADTMTDKPKRARGKKTNYEVLFLHVRARAYIITYNI